VLRVASEASFLVVGEPCPGGDGCRAIEPQVAALAAMLQGLTDAALADDRCSGAPPLP
jgi:hypothetical protein